MITDENLKDCTLDYIDSLDRTIKKYKLINIVLIVAWIACIIVFFISEWNNHRLEQQNKYLKEQLIKDDQMLSLEYSIGYWFINKPEEINDSILYKFLIDNEAWYPEILLKQAKLESGNYTSNIYKNSNNLYGMKKVGKRQTTQTSTYNGYGVYNNWCLSVLDRMLWDMFYFKNEKPNKEDYLKAMSIYAEDTLYRTKIL